MVPCVMSWMSHESHKLDMGKGGQRSLLSGEYRVQYWQYCDFFFPKQYLTWLIDSWLTSSFDSCIPLVSNGYAQALEKILNTAIFT